MASEEGPSAEQKAAWFWEDLLSDLAIDAEHKAFLIEELRHPAPAPQTTEEWVELRERLHAKEAVAFDDTLPPEVQKAAWDGLRRDLNWLRDLLLYLTQVPKGLPTREELGPMRSFWAAARGLMSEAGLPLALGAELPIEARADEERWPAREQTLEETNKVRLKFGLRPLTEVEWAEQQDSSGSGLPPAVAAVKVAAEGGERRGPLVAEGNEKGGPRIMRASPPSLGAPGQRPSPKASSRKRILLPAMRRAAAVGMLALPLLGVPSYAPCLPGYSGGLATWQLFQVRTFRESHPCGGWSHFYGPVWSALGRRVELAAPFSSSGFRAWAAWLVFALGCGGGAVMLAKPGLVDLAPARWHYATAGGRTGPVRVGVLLERLCASADPGAVRVWREGMEAWKPAREVQALASRLPPPLPAKNA